MENTINPWEKKQRPACFLAVKGRGRFNVVEFLYLKHEAPIPKNKTNFNSILDLNATQP